MEAYDGYSQNDKVSCHQSEELETKYLLWVITTTIAGKITTNAKTTQATKPVLEKKEAEWFLCNKSCKITGII